MANGTIAAALPAARATPPFDPPATAAGDGDYDEPSGAGDGEAFGVWEAFHETATETTPEGRDVPSHGGAFVHERDEPSVIRERGGSPFGNAFREALEFWDSSVEEFSYTAQVVGESWGLLLLLGGGVATMVLALITGLDDVDLPRALTASVICYGVTTLLVARSVRRTVTLRLLRSGEGEAAGRGLSSAEVARIVDAVPEEAFVPNDELEGCDASCLEAMLRNRPCGGGDRRARTNAEDSGCCAPAKGGGGAGKERWIAELRKRRKCDAACPICLSAFVRGERIRVLPHCHHEFHSGCIAEWAGTFAVAATNGLGPRGADRCVKRGGPTCPLCKTCIGGAQDALPAEPSTRYEP